MSKQRRLFRSWSAASLSLALAAAPLAATPLYNSAIQPPLGSAIEQQDKIDTVLKVQQIAQRAAGLRWRLALEDKPECKFGKGSLGLSLQDLELYPAEFRDTAAQTFDLVPGLPSIWTVAPGGPADWAGLRVGDSILAINGEQFNPQTMSAGTLPFERAQSALTALPGNVDAKVTIMRAGIVMGFSVPAQPVCSEVFAAAAKDEIALLAKDPRLISQLEMAGSDEELAKILIPPPPKPVIVEAKPAPAKPATHKVVKGRAPAKAKAKASVTEAAAAAAATAAQALQSSGSTQPK